MDPPAPSNTTNPCAISSQDDIYSLGTRTSLYFEWYAGILAYVYSCKEAYLPITTNYLITIACMIHHDDIYSLEIMIVAIIVMAPPLVLLMVLSEFLLFVWQHTIIIKEEDKTRLALILPESTQPESKLKYPRVKLIAYFGVLLSTAFLLGVMVWGPSYGPDVMKKAEGCTPMFGETRYLAGTYATGLRIWSVALIMFAILTIIFFMWYRWSHYLERNDIVTRLVAKFVAMEQGETPLSNGSLNRVFRPVAVVICGGVVSTCVMTIELVIYQNEIQGVGGVGDAGQLIPLTVGLMSFGLMIFERYRAMQKEEDAKKKPKEEEKIAGQNAVNGPLVEGGETSKTQVQTIETETIGA